MSSPSDFELLAKNYAVQAIQFDQSDQHELAITYYLEASQALIELKKVTGQPLSAKIEQKLSDYISRAEVLRSLAKSASQKSSASVVKSQIQKDIDKVVCILNDAMDQDDDKNYQEAFELYTSAVDFYLKMKQNKPTNLSKADEEAFAKTFSYIKSAIERAETLKKLIAPERPPTAGVAALKLGKSEPAPADEDKVEADEDKVEADDDADVVVNKDFSSNDAHANAPQFTREELDVLKRGSFINGREYPPYIRQIDLKERFFFPIPFTDKDGKLALAASQRERFVGWARPDEIFEKPSLMMVVSSFSVKQTCISDCSFVASLTICAQYERKFNKRILSPIIYPQNKAGEPVFNPCGKYMIKLHLNGCARKIVIDDYLPVDKRGELLCSMTTNRGELWVSLLEKAYMKVMGGYDFPGSNSNIDLNALTGWIPERLALHGQHTEFSKEADFKRMFEQLHAGNVLITVATPHISKDEEARTGLVSTHAYAVLDIRKFKDVQLFQLKNPWSHLRWKGNYSEYDVTHWTDELKRALNYDPKLACNIDNGVFWIDYGSLIRHFDVFYLSWNPELFPNTCCLHRKWAAHEGPRKDQYNLSENPQFVLKIRPGSASSSSSSKCVTWLLLTRHITDKDDFAENKEYIALVIYKSNGKRIYYPMEPEPFKEGVRINSPHYLVKLVDEGPGPIIYTLVVSQYEKSKSIFYTLRAYSTQPFLLSEIKEPYKDKYRKTINGEWKGVTAGGCTNNPQTYENNPLYQLTLTNLSSLNSIKIELKAPKEFSVGFDVKCVKSNVENSESNFKHKSTGDYRKGYCVLALSNICGGTYTIRPTTYAPKQESPFILEIHSTNEYSLQQLK